MNADHTPTSAYFDDALGAWVLSRFADVAAALREPRLVMPGTAAPFDASHLAVREAATTEFAIDRLGAWRPLLASRAEERVLALARAEPVDLIREFAAPWSLQLACLVAGLDDGMSDEALALARVIFTSAAQSTDGAVSPDAHDAASTLALLLAQHGRADSHAASVQTFVALSHTLPALLDGAWRALFASASQIAILRRSPERLPAAVSELLRVSCPSRALFRDVAADVQVGDATLRAGDRVILQLAAANRDAARFPAPHELDVHRDTSGHLAFGAGAHRCVGTALVKLAVEEATRALLNGAPSITLVHDDHVLETRDVPVAIATADALWVIIDRPTMSAESAE